MEAFYWLQMNVFGGAKWQAPHLAKKQLNHIHWSIGFLSAWGLLLRRHSPEDSCPSCHLWTCSLPTSSSFCEVVWIQESFLQVQMWDHSSVSLSEKKWKRKHGLPLFRGIELYFHSSIHSINHSFIQQGTMNYSYGIRQLHFLPDNEQWHTLAAHVIHLSP